MPGKESFRSGWQSLLVSLGAGIEQSGAGEPVPPGSAPNLGNPLVEMAESAPTLSLPSIDGKAQSLGGKAQLLKSPTGASEAVLQKVTASVRSIPGWRADISARPIVSGSPRQASVAAKDTATAGSEQSPKATERVNTGKGTKPATNDAAIYVESTMPAQTAYPADISLVQTLNPPQAVPPQIELSARTSGQLEPEESGDLESPGLSIGALPFSNGSQPAGVLPLGAGGIPQAVLHPAETTTKSDGTLESGSSIDELVKGSDTPDATGTKSVPGVETQVGQDTARTVKHSEVETSSKAQDLLKVSTHNVEPVPSALAASVVGPQSIQQSMATAPASKALSFAGERTSAAASIRLNRPSGTSAASQHGSNISQIQPVGQAQESSSPGLARDLAGLRGTAGTTNGGASETSTVIPGPATRDTFSALDAEPASRTSTWIHAGANRAEAGYQDPALGWVSVRANVGGGGIHASLVPTSMDAAQALGAHLAGLNAHLTEQHMPVETLTLAAPEGRGIDSGIDQSLNQNMHQGTGQGSEPNRQPGTGMEGASAAVSTSQVQSSVRGLEETILANRPTGSHISVMA